VEIEVSEFQLARSVPRRPARSSTPFVAPPTIPAASPTTADGHPVIMAKRTEFSLGYTREAAEASPFKRQGLT